MKNKDKIVKYKADYYQKNKDKIAEYLANNKDKISQCRAALRLKQKELNASAVQAEGLNEELL